MRTTGILLSLAAGLVGTDCVRAQDPLSLYSQAGLLPRSPTVQQVQGITELPTLLAPVRTPDSTPAGAAPQGNQADLKNFDRHRFYLPENNPGVRQPPCPCLPLGSEWISAEYLHAITQREGWPGMANGQAEGFRSGLKVNIGLWIDRCQNSGFEAAFFFLQESHTAADGAVARLALHEDNTLNLTGGEANYRWTTFCEDDRRQDVILGYRYLHLGERFSASTNGLGFVPASFLGGVQTENDLHTVQVGLISEWRRGPWYLETTAKVGLGVAVETLDFKPALALIPVNPIRTSESHLVALPEGNLKIGYQLADYWRTYVGYDFTYASEVIRPRSAIVEGLNSGSKRTTDFWMQAIEFGLEARF